MGEVYLARDTALDRDVAIKFVNTAGSSDDAMTRRLVLEAKAVASLDHPGICPVYDAGLDTEGRAFMVMQYVQGETLAARLKRGPLSTREALHLCTRVAEALAAAHRTGVVHRDLKPQNIIVTPSGQPKLVDFGIAKVLAPAASEWETASALTNSYAIAGTPAYMSPEQAQHRPIDARSDLFTLGAILFQCLTGRRPFLGDSPLEVMNSIIEESAPKVSTVRPALGTRFDDVCSRLLAKRPEERYQSADEAAAALSALTHAMGRRRFSTRAMAGLAALFVLVVAAVSVPRWYAHRLPEPPPEAQRWFSRGIEAVREQSYHRGVKALEAGIGMFPDYPMAYLLLAEGRRELDDQTGADHELLRFTERFPDQSRMPAAVRLRLSAIRLTAIGKFDESVAAYQKIAETQPRDAGAWVDLGRAREAAGRLGDARRAYEHAISLDRRYAPAHLRLGVLEAGEGNTDAAKKALDEAYRLYGTASDIEGQTEALIRLGMVLDGEGESAQAAETLGRAVKMANANQNPHQVVRAQLRLSAATASLGRFAEAEDLARQGVDAALAAGWQATAADGLIDFGTTLTKNRKPGEAAVQLERAINLAQLAGAQRTAARARTQRAALHVQQNQPTEALFLVQPQIEFFRQRNHRLQELDALGVAASAYVALDELSRAHALALEMLTIARTLKDAIATRQALVTLAREAAMLGNLPEALKYRGEIEDMSRNGAPDVLPYDILNRAELLVRLGRTDDAQKAIEELERRIAGGEPVYVGRQRSLHVLRSSAALAAGEWEDAGKAASQIDTTAVQPPDVPAQMAQPLIDYARAKSRRARPQASPEAAPNATPGVARERRFWLAMAHLAAGNGAEALRVSSIDLPGVREENDELRWRLAAIGAAAARQIKDPARAEALRTVARDALTRLRTKWGPDATRYELRKDLAPLRAEIGF